MFVTFEYSGLQEAVNKIKSINASELITRTLNDVEKLAPEVAKASLRAQPFKHYPQQLEDSIHAERVSPHELLVVADAGFAAYVEFGTGIVGASAPHVWARGKKVRYDRRAHRLSKGQGWVYHKNGRFHYTRGQTSKPFIYEASKSMRPIILEAFENSVKNHGR